MKALFTVFALMVSFEASAGTIRVACNFEDYQAINKGLESSRIISGAEHAGDLKAMLAEEMGPKCEELVSDEIFFTIPGSRISTYEVSAPGRNYEVVVSVNRVEATGNSVSITRK